jgi:lysophospholipase L1-like esterase
MATHSPDLVIFTCGTNDHIGETMWGEPATSWAFRATVETIKAAKPSVKIVPVLIQYADPLLPGSPQLLTDWIPVTNDRLYSQMLLYPGWFPGIVDWQLIPSNATYLDTTGFHATAKGDLYRGRLVYDRIHAGMGWPAASEPALCDLYGHRKGYTRPSYTPC